MKLASKRARALQMRRYKPLANPPKTQRNIPP
jgi:hypothetical protein